MSDLDDIEDAIKYQQRRLAKVPTTYTKQQVDQVVAEVEAEMRSLNARKARLCDRK